MTCSLAQMLRTGMPQMSVVPARRFPNECREGTMLPVLGPGLSSLRLSVSVDTQPWAWRHNTKQ